MFDVAYALFFFTPDALSGTLLAEHYNMERLFKNHTTISFINRRQTRHTWSKGSVDWWEIKKEGIYVSGCKQQLQLYDYDLFGLFQYGKIRVCLCVWVSGRRYKISTGNFPPHHCDVRLEQFLLSDWMAVNSVLTPNARWCFLLFKICYQHIWFVSEICF